MLLTKSILSVQPEKIFRASALIVCGATQEIKEFEGITSTYKLIANHLKWKDRGTLIADGVWNKGDVQNTEFLNKAEKMGENI